MPYPLEDADRSVLEFEGSEQGIQYTDVREFTPMFYCGNPVDLRVEIQALVQIGMSHIDY